MKQYKIISSITLDFLSQQDQKTYWFDDGFIECDNNHVWYVSLSGKRKETINTVGLINIYIRDKLIVTNNKERKIICGQ